MKAFARGSLFRTLPGRLFLLSSGLLAVLYAAQLVVVLPEIVDLFRRVVSLACLGGLAGLVFVAASRNRHAFLWRVRRKLILSYIFIGFVPLVLVLAFALTGGMLLYITVAGYVFLREVRDVVDDARQIAEASAIEIGRTPADAQAVIDARYGSLAARYPQLSLAVAPVAVGAALSAGAWDHGPPIETVPGWVVERREFSGTLASPVRGQPGDLRLLIRAASPTPDMRRYVIVDLPVDPGLIARLEEYTGTRLGGVAAERCGTSSGGSTAPTRSVWSLFRETVSFLDCTRWDDGGTGNLYISVEAPLGVLVDRLASVRSVNLEAAVGASWWAIFVNLLIVLGVLFLIIQGAALVMGGVLARSITSAVHALFAGTERIRQGDFAHRIGITSRDQLGDLAASFDRMSASIEYLLLVQREKQRLDDELRIAREIQKSLLPVRPPGMAGVDLADLCEPAREVGGDYYDFFELGPRQLGVLVADVSGKGTSAALYMAELKGLVLALSHRERSPRRLLIELNRLLADHLDNRSFITMTYAVLDLDQWTMTSARAGHTPLIVVSGGESEVITSGGMVLGLRLPGADEMFTDVLDEHTRDIRPGDLVVFYTDGITEAMDVEGNLFGDDALARVVSGRHELDAAGIRERVVREVKEFVGGAEQHDDMTMVVVRIGGEAA